MALGTYPTTAEPVKKSSAEESTTSAGGSVERAPMSCATTMPR